MTREAPEERAARILAELRAATAEAAGVLKDLKAAAKAARVQADDYLGQGVNEALLHYKAEVEQVAQHYNTECHKDLTRMAKTYVDRAEIAINNAISIEAAADLLAKKIAAIIRKRGDRSVMDFRIDTRGIAETDGG